MIDFPALVAAVAFDAEDRPAAGTACAWCQQRGHWCPAKGFCGEHALCLACGRSEPCEQEGAVDRFHRGEPFEEFEADERSCAGEVRQIEISEADRVIEEKAVEIESSWARVKASLSPENLKRGLRRDERAPRSPRPMKGPRKRRHYKPRQQGEVGLVKEEVCAEAAMEQKLDKEAAKVEAIRLAAAGMKVNAIVKQLGYHWGLVNKWVKGSGGTQKARGTAKKPSRAAVEATAVSKAALARPGVAEEPKVEVKIRVAERHLNAFFAACSLEEKVIAFQAVLEAR